jgi:hypothetical protein
MKFVDRSKDDWRLKTVHRFCKMNVVARTSSARLRPRMRMRAFGSFFIVWIADGYLLWCRPRLSFDMGTIVSPPGAISALWGPVDGVQAAAAAAAAASASGRASSPSAAQILGVPRVFSDFD